MVRCVTSDPFSDSFVLFASGTDSDCASSCSHIQVGVKVPLVVRLEGTNVEEGKKILADAASAMPTLISASDLDDAAIKAVKAIS